LKVDKDGCAHVSTAEGGAEMAEFKKGDKVAWNNHGGTAVHKPSALKKTP
jgi:hypothetical protein